MQEEIIPTCFKGLYPGGTEGNQECTKYRTTEYEAGLLTLTTDFFVIIIQTKLGVHHAHHGR
jgi:hypothetical protein